MQMVLNLKNQNPNYFFVRKNRSEMTALVAKFFLTIDKIILISTILIRAADYERFPLVSSCQKEKPTT
jgi:hypothetical protein